MADSLFEENYVEFSERGQEALTALTALTSDNFGSSAYRFSAFSDFFKLDVTAQIQNKKETPEDLEAKKTMDKDYAPLSQHCVRALCDKMYDKRKAAALEIEK